MKKNMKRFLAFIEECFGMIFFGAAENHILLSHSGKKKFYSYTQLKKHQKKVRKIFMSFVGGIVLLLLGVVIGPAILPVTYKAEIYIPSGRGDILIGNVSKNQATVIFKTLNARDSKKPLATKAYVEVYEDENLKKMVAKSEESDYAVTHMIPINNLKEGNQYYFQIVASDSADFSNAKKVFSWGEGKDPIKVFTTGEPIIPKCTTDEIRNMIVLQQENKESFYENAVVQQTDFTNVESIDDAEEATEEDKTLKISNVQNENHLQPQNKVQTIISWKTNFPATTVLEYSEGTNGERKKIVISDKKTIKHAAVLTTLKAGTVYYFKVISEDENGNLAVSKDYSLRTPIPKDTVLQQIAKNFKGLIFQMNQE
ncbi:MAG: hypothetical protein ACOYB5_00200 [Patescibacteria group bacterium]|jgi:hypothetical protein